VPINITAVVGAVDPDRLCVIVDAVKESVGAAAGTMITGQLAPQWLADAARFAR
jgi:hypothetical protein